MAELDLDDDEVADGVERIRAAEMARMLADPAGHLAERIVEIGNAVRGEGIIATRPGQMARMETLAKELAEIASELRRLDRGVSPIGRA